MRNVFSFFAFVFFIVALTGAANAQVKDRTFKDWTVYTTSLQGKKTCYMASFPKSKAGNYKRRDEPYLLVTRIGANADEVSTSSGYKYKKNSEVKATVEGKSYKLFTKGELAWAQPGKDAEIVERMKKKNFIKLRGTSIKGTYSVDKYSLSGFTAAHKRMHEICG